MRLSSIRRHIARKFKSGEAKTEQPPVAGQPKNSDEDISFLPDMNQWVRTHYVGVVDEFMAAIGSLEGKRILDLGCGEMLMTYGLASRGAEEVVGLDITKLDPDKSLKTLVDGGFPDAANYRDRVSAAVYDGKSMPFPDEHFDIIFCWGVMEHVADVPAVLAEIKRVLKTGGIAFIKVFPWFHSYFGSHLSDFVPVPFAHLTHDQAAMRAIIEKTAHEQTVVHPDMILDHMWKEYLTLNRYSADMFYRDVKAAGFSRDIWTLISRQHDLTDAPPGYELSQLMVSGSDTILHK
ncbi:class I SAM-dependent methyltransferase [Sphingobium abikonense]|uniref:class I SAM-dependent methyltransferase n=1 Tax=Sphingobium abikonense TaxID=86193 RepID=UPI00351438C4